MGEERERGAGSLSLSLSLSFHRTHALLSLLRRRNRDIMAIINIIIQVGEGEGGGGGGYSDQDGRESGGARGPTSDRSRLHDSHRIIQHRPPSPDPVGLCLSHKPLVHEFRGCLRLSPKVKERGETRTTQRTSLHEKVIFRALR